MKRGEGGEQLSLKLSRFRDSTVYTFLYSLHKTVLKVILNNLIQNKIMKCLPYIYISTILFCEENKEYKSIYCRVLKPR